MLGLALEGGGAKGSYHAGALKALYENGYDFAVVAGTSIGALNGAVLAEKGYQRLYDWWQTLEPSHLFDVEDEEIKKILMHDYDRKSLMHFARFVGSGLKNGGFPTDGLKKLIESLVDEDALRAAPMDFGLVTYSLTDKQPIEVFKADIPYGKLHEYIMASAYFPAFKLQPITDKKYIDGGIYNNLPLNPLIRKGYDELVAIRTNSNMPHIAVIDDTVKIMYINPSDDIGTTYSLSEKRVSENLTMGYFDAVRAIKGYRGKKFYVLPMSDDEFDAFFDGFGEDFFLRLSKFLGLQNASKEKTRRAFFAFLSKQFDAELTVTDFDAFIALLEAGTKNLDINRYEIMSLPNLMSKIKAAHVAKNEDANFVLAALQNIRAVQSVFNFIIENYNVCD